MRKHKYKAYSEKMGMSQPIELMVMVKNDFSLIEDDVIWLEFTGLKDKNRKEIYEGDILSYDRTVAYQYDKFIWVAPVGINIDGSYEMQCKQVDGDEGKINIDWRIYPYQDHMEVIGNIYESPELLEDV